MLRITVQDDPHSVTFRLEGRLAGTWVHELRDCWQSTLEALPKPVVRFDLQEVTYIDDAGKEFLATALGKGVELIASGCLMRAIVAELTDTAFHCGGNSQISSATSAR